MQEGNYLAVKFDADTDTVITCTLIGGDGNVVTIDSDMNLVVRVADLSQALYVKAVNGDSVYERTYPLNKLTLEPKPVVEGE